MDEREIELESRMAWYEKQLADLDGVVRLLSDEVARLRRELDELREDQLPEIGPASDRPPHY